MVELTDVCFGYRDSPVIEDVRLQFAEPGVVCLLGPNGAGKSTVLKLIAGLLQPSRGTVRFRNACPYSAPRREIARQLSYLPQDYRVTFPFTAIEIVRMGRYPHTRGFLADRSAAEQTIVADSMAQCDVDHLAERGFNELSGGEQRLVLLAQAFCQQCPVLLLDEPTANLDPAHAIAVFTALRAHCKETGAMAIVVTHDLNLAARFADRLVVLGGNQVVCDAAPDAALQSGAVQKAFGVGIHTGQIPGGHSAFAVPGELA